MLNPASSSDLIALARQIAVEHSLPPELVCAVIEQESAWNCWAVRYEPEFYQRYVVPQLQPKCGLRPALPLAHASISVATEARARAFSWGLMQVMGQVAREHGFGGVSLAELCDPAAGLHMGCTVLAAKLAAAGRDVARALLLWNGGANSSYAAAVLARVPRYATQSSAIHE